ncbi:hypothetical protein HK096_009441, partial [Nowakowskiella sp. JEL0078]
MSKGRAAFRATNIYLRNSTYDPIAGRDITEVPVVLPSGFTITTSIITPKATITHPSIIIDKKKSRDYITSKPGELPDCITFAQKSSESHILAKSSMIDSEKVSIEAIRKRENVDDKFVYKEKMDLIAKNARESGVQPHKNFILRRRNDDYGILNR